MKTAADLIDLDKIKTDAEQSKKYNRAFNDVKPDTILAMVELCASATNLIDNMLEVERGLKSFEFKNMSLWINHLKEKAKPFQQQQVGEE